LASKTISEYKEVIKACKEVFEKKTRDYGTAWRILRLSSITDQIMIKAQRIRSIQEKGFQKVDDGIGNYQLTLHSKWNLRRLNPYMTKQ